MISARGFDGHTPQQRMIQIGRFQPGNVRCDSKQILQHRQRATSDCCRDDAIADGQSALQSEHAPVIGHRVKPIDRPDQPKRQ